MQSETSELFVNRSGRFSIHRELAKELIVLFAVLILGDALALAQIDRLTLGARFNASGSRLTFRVYSSRATRVELFLYAQPTGADEVARIPLVRNSDASVWSTTVPLKRIRKQFGISGIIYYGYRAWGPNWTFDPTWKKGSKAGFVSDVDADGNRFNPNKLLYDPYARELSHDPITPQQRDGTIYASGPDHFLRDTGKEAAKGIVLTNQTVDVGSKPQRALKDDVIYEVNVRGLTEADTSVSAEVRGTYAGAAAKAAALKTLGITAIEFLPVQETQNDANGLDPPGPDGDNYWGYSTLDYFAPDRRYSSDKSPGGPTREFEAMTKAFHDQGIKVFIDVVYNHTGEGYAYGKDPSTYNLMSWRGLDNRTYYVLTDDNQFSYDNTGVGGDYNTANPVAQDLIVDSLAWWRDQLGVDGFRFDLAAVLGNTCQRGCFNFDKISPRTALNRIARDLSPRPGTGGVGVDLIGEPWAASGDGAYQLGNFPAGWSEWNGKFRDDVRASQNELGVAPFTTATLATRFTGSADLFKDNGRRPWNSINFVVAHDGFTLADLYRFNFKNNNQPFPAGPSDGGSNDNISWDQGGNATEQRKAARNGLALLMLSAGTPMMTGGDEFLRSLNGNNNPYNLDTAFNWLNYQFNDQQRTFATFAQRLIAFRAAHPALRPVDFYTPAQVRWFRPDGGEADSTYFTNPNNHAIAWTIDGAAFQDPTSSLYIAYNAWSGDVTFTLPSPGGGKSWFRAMDTSPFLEAAGSVVFPGTEEKIGGANSTYILGSRAVLLLVAK